jgi:hypothetical protein
MTLENILKHVDHTLLAVTATSAEYINLCDEGIKHNVASVRFRAFEVITFIEKFAFLCFNYAPHGDSPFAFGLIFYFSI